MIASDFTTLVSLCGRLDLENDRKTFLACMRQLHGRIQENPSASALLLYQELRQRAVIQVPDIVIPSFYDDGFLEEHFDRDPSNFAVAFGLAMKNLHNGNKPRAVQLLNRIAKSQYKESCLARRELDKLENILPFPVNG